MAAAQHAVFTGAHARLLGFSKRQIDYRVASGQWVRVFNYAFRVSGAPRTWEGDLLAACWAGGFRAVASHGSAAALWGLPGGRRNVVEITCPRWRRAKHDGLIVHESKALDPIELTIRNGMPVTCPEITLLHLAAVSSPALVEMALDNAESRELVTRKSVKAMLKRQGRRGRNGVGVLRPFVRGKRPGRRPPDSPMETRLIQVLRRNGFPEPVPQFDIYDDDGHFVARVDAAFPQWRIGIEYESGEHHKGNLALERDSSRRNRIWAANWIPHTATRRDIANGGVELCSAIRAAQRRVLAPPRHK